MVLIAALILGVASFTSSAGPAPTIAASAAQSMRSGPPPSGEMWVGSAHFSGLVSGVSKLELAPAEIKLLVGDRELPVIVQNGDTVEKLVQRIGDVCDAQGIRNVAVGESVVIQLPPDQKARFSIYCDDRTLSVMYGVTSF